jgi:hypothetical protein
LDDAQLRAELARLSDAADKLSAQSNASAGIFERVGKSLGMTAESISNTSFAMKQIQGGVVSFNRAISSSEVTFNKYNQTVTQVTGGLGGIFANFGTLGKALGAVTEVVGDLVGSVFKQNDQYLSAYDTLAKFGYAGEGTADSLFDITKNTGYLGDQLTDLVSITTGLGTDLTGLGSTAGQGIKTFFDIATISKEQRAAYIRLGYSQKEITQNQADYIKQQIKLGGIRTKDLTQLRERSLNYSKQLMELAALTGQTPEAIKAKQQEALKDYAFNMSIREEAKKSGKDEEEVRTRILAGLTQVDEAFGEDTKKGFMDLFARGPAAQSDEAQAMRLVAGDSIYKWMKQYKEGTIDINEFNKRYREANNRFNETSSEMVIMNKEMADKAKVSAERNASNSKEFNSEREKNIKRQTESQMVPKEGGIKETQIKLIETQLEVQTAFQTLVKLIADYVNPAFTYMLKGLDQLTQGLMSTLSHLGVVDADFPYMFKDAGELNKILLEKQGRLVDLQKDKEQTTKLEALGIDLSKPADVVKKAYVDQQIKLQEKEIDALKKRLKALTGSDRPNLSPPVSTSGSANGTGGGDFSTTNNLNFGISSGPTEGYNGFLNDDLQAVVPLPDGKSIPVSFKNLPSELLSKRKNPLSQSDDIASLLSGYAASMVNNINQTNTVSFNQTANDDKSGIINLVASKMDTLLDNISKNNQLQNDMLVYLKR